MLPLFILGIEMTNEHRRGKRNVFLLAACQALMMSCNSLLISISALVGAALATEKWLATVPLGLQFLATMLCTLPASLLMRSIGRRAGFILGTLAGLAGAVVSTYAVLIHSFPWLCAGAFLFGVFNAFAQYYRFAAADTATPEFRSRAISLVLAGGVIAAFAGPNLASATRELAAVPFAGSYASLLVLFAASALLLVGLHIPRAGAAEYGASRPIAVIARQPSFLAAVTGATVAYVSMNLLMTATPLAMNHAGHSFGDTALVIEWHVLGMFAPAFITGHLINRFGVTNIMFAGVVLLGACVGVNLLGGSVAHFWLALLLLGMGWNFLFVGATTLLTETYGLAEKAKVQGVNDLLIFGMVALSATTSGMLHHALGWQAMNLGVVPLLVLCLVVLCAVRRPQRLAGAVQPNAASRIERPRAEADQV